MRCLAQAEGRAQPFLGGAPLALTFELTRFVEESSRSVRVVVGARKAAREHRCDEQGEDAAPEDHRCPTKHELRHIERRTCDRHARCVRGKWMSTRLVLALALFTWGCLDAPHLIAG